MIKKAGRCSLSSFFFFFFENDKKIIEFFITKIILYLNHRGGKNLNVKN